MSTDPEPHEGDALVWLAQDILADLDEQRVVDFLTAWVDCGGLRLGHVQRRILKALIYSVGNRPRRFDYLQVYAYEVEFADGLGLKLGQVQTALVAMQKRDIIRIYPGTPGRPTLFCLPFNSCHECAEKVEGIQLGEILTR